MRHNPVVWSSHIHKKGIAHGKSAMELEELYNALLRPPPFSWVVVFAPGSTAILKIGSTIKPSPRNKGTAQWPKYYLRNFFMQFATLISQKL